MSGQSIHSVSVAGVTFDEDERVLLVRRRDNGQWQAPGGILETDETFEQGVVREVLEETGVTVQVERLTGVYKNLTLGVVALVYRCYRLTGHPLATPESADSAWLNVDYAMSLMVPAFAIRVSDARDGGQIAPASRAHDGIRLL